MLCGLFSYHSRLTVLVRWTNVMKQGCINSLRGSWAGVQQGCLKFWRGTGEDWALLPWLVAICISKSYPSLKAKNELFSLVNPAITDFSKGVPAHSHWSHSHRDNPCITNGRREGLTGVTWARNQKCSLQGANNPTHSRAVVQSRSQSHQLICEMQALSFTAKRVWKQENHPSSEHGIENIKLRNDVS